MLRKTIPLFVAILAVTGCADTTTPSPAVPGTHEVHDAVASGRGDLGPDVHRMLAEVRRATAKYHDIDRARADGYRVFSPALGAGCPFLPGQGQMGYHLVNVGLRGSPSDPANADPNLEMLRPEMLIYELRSDGKPHLVGVEYLVFKAAWEADNGIGAAPPRLFGMDVPLSTHAFPPSTVPVPHYELHVWLWSGNPNGMFAPYNPKVSC